MQLYGGGSLAIGWELGYLLTLSNQGIDVRHADLMIGTSGGAQAATGLTSDKSFDVIYDEQLHLNQMKRRQLKTCQVSLKDMLKYKSIRSHLKNGLRIIVSMH